MCHESGTKETGYRVLYVIDNYEKVILKFSVFISNSRNRWYMSNPENMPADYVTKVKPMLNKVPSADQYLNIIKLCKAALDSGKYEYHTFPELSYYAWIISEKVNQEQREAETGKKSSQSNAAHIRWTRPIVQALRDLGGSGTSAEVRAKIVENEHLTEEETSVTRGKTNVNKFENEVAFARNDLAVAGYIDKSIRGVWTLTEAGMTVDITDEMASDLFKNTVAESAAKRSGDSGALADSNVDTIRYWIYAPGSGAEKWDECYKNGIMLLGWGEIGDLNTFDSKDEMKQKMKEVYGDISTYKNSAHATGQFVHDLKPGDVVFVKKGIYGIIGRGVVESAYEYDAERSDEFNNIVAVLRNKKNIILQGAPGVGKTFVAKRLAYAIMGVKDVGRVMMVQFHQSYSYEDFIMGFRPAATGFELRKGAFYNFCKKAEIDSDNDYFFIIDEINRGNLSKIFGELFMLIENDKRGIEASVVVFGREIRCSEQCLYYWYDEYSRSQLGNA